MSYVIRNPQRKNFKPSLEGFKKRHETTAREKGVEKAFMMAKTITEAKKILKGAKGPF